MGYLGCLMIDLDGYQAPDEERCRILRLGGTVTVDSTPGRGTRFTIDIPQRTPEAEPCPS